MSKTSNNNSINELHLAKNTFTNNRPQVKNDENQIALNNNDLDSIEIEKLKNADRNALTAAG